MTLAPTVSGRPLGVLRGRRRPPETIRAVRVLDREAHRAWYEAPRTVGRVDRLVRARQDRPLAGGGVAV